MSDDRIDTLRFIGNSMARTASAEHWPEMPARATLVDIFHLRLQRPKFGLPFAPAAHCVQCATLALKAGHDEETVLACLLHDIGFAVMRPDHGWWGAQLVEPYVSEKVTWAIRHHQALRFYPDPSVGYKYPELYVQMFGHDYEPPEYIAAAYESARKHRWYMAARSITLYDDYGFDTTKPLDLTPFAAIIARHFRQPATGLGNDNSPSTHMWRTIIDPNKPL